MRHIASWSNAEAFTSEVWMGSIAEFTHKVHQQFPTHSFALVSDENVLKHHKLLLKNGHLFSFPAGEVQKTRRMKELLEDQMLAAGLGRDTCLIAMGGGVVTDLSGFLAATYCRGIPWVAIPTTLLGMVDAAIGGKTGVNTKEGKNLIGAFYPPHEVLLDLSFLGTLPPREMLSGSAEMIKYSLIASPELFRELQQGRAEWAAREGTFLQKIISQCAQIKSAIVQGDFRESGRRRILNFGHTIGHAIEKCEHYQISHGEAVAIGMLVESFISHRLKYLSSKAFESICTLIKSYGFSRPDHPLSLQTMKEAMLSDKKTHHGKPRSVLLQNIGEPVSFNGEYCAPIDDAILEEALSWVSHAI